MIEVAVLAAALEKSTDVRRSTPTGNGGTPEHRVLSNTIANGVKQTVFGVTGAGWLQSGYTTLNNSSANYVELVVDGVVCPARMAMRLAGTATVYVCVEEIIRFNSSLEWRVYNGSGASASFETTAHLVYDA